MSDETLPPIEPEDFLNPHPLEGWRIVRERLLRDENVMEIIWESPEGEVIMRWPVEDCVA